MQPKPIKDLLNENKTENDNLYSIVLYCILYVQQINVTIMCRNEVELDDELSWLFTNILSATRYMKVKENGNNRVLPDT